MLTDWEEGRLNYNQEQSEKFQDIAREPLHWLWQADVLRRSASLLLSNLLDVDEKIRRGIEVNTLAVQGFAPVCMMLMGFSLENLIKGLVASKEGQITADGKFGWDHNLNKLFQRAGVPLDPSDMEFLVRLQEFITWAGRYPLPKKATDFSNRSEQEPPYMQLRSDSTKFVELYTRVLDMYPVRFQGVGELPWSSLI